MFLNFANIRHLVYWKCIIWAKPNLSITNSVCKNVWLTINDPPKMLFLNFLLFPFSRFQMTIAKNLIPNFEGSFEVLYVTNIFNLHIFEHEMTALLKFLKFPRNAFCFFIFSKWKKYYNLPLDDTFKMCRWALG